MSLPFLPVRSESLTSWNLPKPVFASNSTSNSNSPTNICTTTVVSVSGADAKSAGKVVREKCSAASFAQISLEKSLACHVTGVRECVGYLICAFILLERMVRGGKGGCFMLVNARKKYLEILNMHKKATCHNFLPLNALNKKHLSSYLMNIFAKLLPKSRIIKRIFTKNYNTIEVA